MPSTLEYLRDHWRGSHSLLWSFWVNLVFGRLIIFALEITMREVLDQTTFLLVAAKTVFFIVFHVIILVWQIVGTVRAAETHMQATGSSLPLWATYIGCLTSLILTANVVLGTNRPIQYYDFLRTMADIQAENRKSQYKLKYDRETHSINFSGIFVIGVRRAFAELFKQEKGIRRVVFESKGGSIYEARGVARLLVEHQVTTHIKTTCASACALAYLSGIRRSISPGGRLGFHKYDFNFANKQPHPMINLAEEHDADRRYMRNRGLSDDFLKKVFAQAHSDIWFPNTEELRTSGAVHSVATGS